MFDLELLLRRRNASGADQPELSPEHSMQAANRALEISFDSYTSEVAPFLDADIASLYDEAEWDRMRELVATSLEEIATKGGLR